MNSAGTFLLSGATYHVQATGSEPEAVTNVSAFGVKVGGTPALAGKTYRFEAFQVKYGNGDAYPAYMLGTHVASSTLTFNDDNTVSVTVNLQTVARADDVTSIVPASELDQPITVPTPPDRTG